MRSEHVGSRESSRGYVEVGRWPESGFVVLVDVIIMANTYEGRRKVNINLRFFTSLGAHIRKCHGTGWQCWGETREEWGICSGGRPVPRDPLD